MDADEFLAWLLEQDRYYGARYIEQRPREMGVADREYQGEGSSIIPGSALPLPRKEA